MLPDCDKTHINWKQLTITVKSRMIFHSTLIHRSLSMSCYMLLNHHHQMIVLKNCSNMLKAETDKMSIHHTLDGTGKISLRFNDKLTSENGSMKVSVVSIESSSILTQTLAFFISFFHLLFASFLFILCVYSSVSDYFSV